jgi:opacity protein-like surface antigen
MKQRRSTWARTTGAAALLLALGAQAQDQKWYVRVDAGGTLVNNTRVTEVIVPTSFTTEFDAGFGFGLAGGYHVTPWLGVEFQTGYTLNGVKGFDAVLMQTPLMVNAVYECHHCGKFVPFIGAGVGGMTSFFSINSESLWTGTGYATIDGTGVDTVFAYQFFGGFHYEINDTMSVGFLYRFSGSEAPSWDVEDAYYGDTIGQIGFDNLYTHSFSLVFNMKF